jgi:hypothetical protein
VAGGIVSMMWLNKSPTDRVPQKVTKFTPVSGGASLGPSSRLGPWQPEQFCAYATRPRSACCDV